MDPLAPYVAIPLLIGAAISFTLSIYAWGRREEPGVFAFMLTAWGLGGWSITYAIELLSVGIEAKLFWHKIVYTVIPLVPGPWALFLYQHEQLSSKLPRWVRPALFIEPVLFVFFTWTNDSWHFLWTDVRLLDGPGIDDLELSRGLGFWMHTAYSYLLILYATVVFIRMLWREKKLPRWQVGLLGLSALSPMLVNVIHVLGFNPIYPIDLTPFALATTGATSAWYAFRFEIWDFLPAARNAIVESMNDGVIVLDSNNIVVDVNPAALHLLSIKRESAVEKPIGAVLPSWPELQAIFARAANSGTFVTPLEIVWSTREKVRYIDLVFSPLYDRSNRPSGSLLTLRNVTRRKSAEMALAEERNSLEQRVAEQTADLRQANAQLARAARLKDEFLASMSHELRTPLNTVLGLSEALQEQVYGSLNERQLRALRNIEDSGRHLLSLINDILDVSKIEAGKLTLEFRPTSIDSVCQASVGLVRQIAHKKKIDVTYAPDPAVHVVLADERRLKQILVNLLTNAVKFTPEGGKVQLEVTGDREHETIRFCVSDTGIGIAEVDIPRLFQPFMQLDSSLARQHEGTGLGLALVYRMTELHGGSVSVESQVGVGSRFTIALPWRESTIDVLVSRDPEAATNLLKAMRRVLIIDSSSTSADQVRRYLQELGAEVFIESNGYSGLAQAQLVSPDLIIMDLFLPDRSGWDVLAELRVNPITEATPVLILSVVDVTQSSERLFGFKLGRVYHTLKPVSRQQFSDVLVEIFSPHTLPTTPLPPPPLPNRNANGQNGFSPYVMIVEDNENNINTLSDYLLAKGYRLHVARSGPQALAGLREIRPDVILMDVQMPGMDGLETIREIRTHEPGQPVPIIALTALAMPGDRERILKAGANDYLSKPLSMKRLVSLIERYAKHSALTM